MTQTDHKPEHANVQTLMSYADAVDVTSDIRLRHALAPGFPSAALPAGVRLFRNSLAPSESWDAPLFHPSRSHLTSTILSPCRPGARIFRISGFGSMATGSSMDFTPPQPQGLVHRYLPATADCQLPKLPQTGSSLHTWLWLGAHSGSWNGVAQLPMLFHVTVSTQGHKVIEGVVALLAPLDLVVDLQKREGQTQSSRCAECKPRRPR